FAAPAGAHCLAGEEPRTVASLFMGVGSKTPSADTAFTDFLDHEVSTRFPEGLTVLDAQGRWMNAQGKIGRENSKLLLIVLPGKPDDRARILDIASAYNSIFNQEAVLVTYDESCVVIHRGRTAPAR
ncbi:MAG: hypothetical protein JWR77_2422, partial [Rhizorhabdus sp.]|nr:hypothetical protein [Rhizorhabdus sp.]